MWNEHKRRRYKKQSQVLVLGPDKRRLNMNRGTRSFWLEEQIMRLVKSNESERGCKINPTNKLTVYLEWEVHGNLLENPCFGDILMITVWFFCSVCLRSHWSRQDLHYARGPWLSRGHLFDYGWPLSAHWGDCHREAVWCSCLVSRGIKQYNLYINRAVVNLFSHKFQIALYSEW